MPRHGQITSQEEVRSAYWEGIKGGANGAARWGIITGLAGLAAYFFSPVYRGLTPQFKIYLQMSGMTFGGMVEAERRVREFENRSRRLRKLQRDQEAWRRYEEDFESEIARDRGKTEEPPKSQS